MPAGYSIASFGAGLFALVLLVLLVASAGDLEHTYGLPVWFSWCTVYLVVLVADTNVARTPTQQRTRVWHRYTRAVLSLVVALESLAFAIWLTVEWTRDAARVVDGFYGVATVTLWVQMLVALAILYMSLVVGAA